MESLFIPVTPIAKPRMTGSDRWRKRKIVVAYWHFKDEVNLFWKNNKINHPWDITFFIPMPPSYKDSKKARLVDTPHQIRPDLDNYLKAFFDAVLDEDKIIWQIKAQKLWSYKGGILIKSL